MPKVSVVIPAYNRAESIGRAISSVFAQTFSDFELIVVDDGSTDGTAACASAFDRPDLRVIVHERNRGAAAARNTGIAAAEAPLVAFLDSDDEWLPDKLARQVRRLEETEAAACCSGFLLERGGTISERRLPETRGWRARLLRGCTVSPGSTLVVERRCFGEIGPFDESLGRFEDWEWLLRFTARHKLVAVGAPLAVVHGREWPSIGVVRAALDALERRVQLMPGLSPAERHAVLCTMDFERAVALWRNGAPLAGAGRLLRSCLWSPGPTARLLLDVQRRRRVGAGGGPPE